MTWERCDTPPRTVKTRLDYSPLLLATVIVPWQNWSYFTILIWRHSFLTIMGRWWRPRKCQNMVVSILVCFQPLPFKTSKNDCWPSFFSWKHLIQSFSTLGPFSLTNLSKKAWLASSSTFPPMLFWKILMISCLLMSVHLYTKWAAPFKFV